MNKSSIILKSLLVSTCIHFTALGSRAIEPLEETLDTNSQIILVPTVSDETEANEIQNLDTTNQNLLQFSNEIESNETQHLSNFHPSFDLSLHSNELDSNKTETHGQIHQSFWFDDPQVLDEHVLLDTTNQDLLLFFNEPEINETQNLSNFHQFEETSNTDCSTADQTMD